MALDAKTTITHPLQINLTAGSNSGIAILIGSGSPDGNTDPWSSALKGSVHIRIDATDDYPALYGKVDEDSADDDWAPYIIEKSNMNHQLNGNLTFSTDKRVYFRDTDNSIYSDSGSKLYVTAPSGMDIFKVKVGSGHLMSNVLCGSATIVYGAVASMSASTACLSITGLTQEHKIFISTSAIGGSLMLQEWSCSPGGGVLAMTVTNWTASTTATCDLVFGYYAVAACGA